MELVKKAISQDEAIAYQNERKPRSLRHAIAWKTNKLPNVNKKGRA